MNEIKAIAAKFKIQTERLLLRPWKDADLAPFAEMSANPEVMEFFPAILSAAESNAMVGSFCEHFEKYGFGWAACELKSSSEFIGFVGLHRIEYETSFSPCVEIGWRIARKHWGQGFAVEGAEAMLEFGFKNLGLTEIVSMTAVGNLKSRRVMEKIGMTRNSEEDFDHPKVSDGHPLKRHVLYRIQKARETNG
jgi:RimJ/RimL family protein N-acetyltransferase